MLFCFCNIHLLSELSDFSTFFSISGLQFITHFLHVICELNKTYSMKNPKYFTIFLTIKHFLCGWKLGRPVGFGRGGGCC